MSDSIIEKIAKLLTLGESPNENEALAAIAKAQALMSKHNIKVEQIRRETKQGYSFNKSRITIGKGKSLPNWKRNLLAIICKYNNCKMYFYSGTGDVLVIGEDIDISFVLMVYFNVENTAEKLADIAFSEAITLEHGKRWKNSYYYGFVNRISQRLEEEHSISTTAIMVYKKDALESYISLNVKAGKRAAGAVTINGSAYRQGYSDGGTVQIR